MRSKYNKQTKSLSQECTSSGMNHFLLQVQHIYRMTRSYSSATKATSQQASLPKEKQPHKPCLSLLSVTRAGCSLAITLSQANIHSAHHQVNTQNPDLGFILKVNFFINQLTTPNSVRLQISHLQVTRCPPTEIVLLPQFLFILLPSRKNTQQNPCNTQRGKTFCTIMSVCNSSTTENLNLFHFLPHPSALSPLKEKWVVLNKLCKSWFASLSYTMMYMPCLIIA